MAAKRRTLRELNDARNSKRHEEMELAIAEGRLTVRQMTPTELAQAKLDRASGDDARAARDRAKAARAIRLSA